LQVVRRKDSPSLAERRLNGLNVRFFKKRLAGKYALGYLRVMFTVEDIDDTLVRLHKHGAQLVGKVVQYEDAYRRCYIRGPEGILIGLAQELRAPAM